MGGSCYAATKHAVVGFSESLLLEVRDAGVRVSLIMPGSVDTQFRQRQGDKSWMLSASDVADAVLFAVDQSANSLISRVELRPLRKS